MTTDDLLAAASGLAARARMEKLPRWDTTVQVTVDGEPWAAFSATSATLTITPGARDAQTVVEMTSTALESWLADGVDFTHLVKDGTIVVSHGSYFDLLLLSKALGLRSDRPLRDEAVAR